MISQLGAECVLESGCLLGEGPLWNHRRGELEFVDIMSGRLHHFEPRSGRHTVSDVGTHIGAFAPRIGGGYVVAVKDGFGFVPDGGTSVEMVAPVLAEHADLRMNDGKCDPGGRFFAGSMSYQFTPGVAALHRLDTDGSVETVLGGVTISNGLDWTDDRRTMYYVDSMAGGIDAFDFDDASGRLGNRRRLVDVPNDTASPCGLTVCDGLTLDVEGALWVAVHGTGEVRRYDPQRGELLQVITIPVLETTSVAFGGDDLDELYITCAGEQLSPDHRHPTAGGVFRARPGVRGRAANLFAG
jgi:sugar lactone lactonase YvrE